jgi:hypothetical protein
MNAASSSDFIPAHIVSLNLKFAALLLLTAGMLPAQTVRIFSELQRIDPFGNVLEIDRSPSPREIISPAIARNSFASFHIAVSVPPGQNYFLHVQSQPPGILGIRLYKEQFLHFHGDWIPDTLQEVATPAFGVIPEGLVPLPGQTSRDYLLDIWAPPDAEVGRRVRVEVLLKLGTWMVAPMEVRITTPVLHEPANASQAPLPALDEPADSAGVHALTAHFSGLTEWNRAPILTVRDVLRRNAQQDMLLAGPRASPALWLRSASQIVNGWGMFPSGAEWYLRIRDMLISQPRP